MRGRRTGAGDLDVRGATVGEIEPDQGVGLHRRPRRNDQVRGDLACLAAHQPQRPVHAVRPDVHQDPPPAMRGSKNQAGRAPVRWSLERESVNNNGAPISACFDGPRRRDLLRQEVLYVPHHQSYAGVERTP